MRLVFSFIFTLCLGIISSSEADPVNAHAPILVDGNDVAVTSYRGNISQAGGARVSLRPALRALDQDGAGAAKFICGYKIYPAVGDQTVPFAAILKKHKSGLADIVLDRGVELDPAVRRLYAFNISAYDCGTPTRMSPKIPVQITVTEYLEPVWQEKAYFAEVEEGSPKEAIVTVKATERGTSEGICSYSILTPNQPFTINDKGEIRLAPGRKLVYEDQHNHILAVQATDCEGRRAKPVMVNLIVKPECKLGWQGITERLDYYPGQGRQSLAAEARFDKCRAPCREERVTATVYLTTKGQNEGCDHDSVSVKSQKKLCGALADGVDLLPPPEVYASWTDERAPVTDDADRRDDVYYFDGVSNAVKVPDGKVNHTLTDHLTLMVWLKHGHDMNSNRENIVCNADGEQMSRHHYALFIRNCRLVFLLRQEFNKKDFDVFKPAEWRWKIPEVCDGKWHHYAVSVDFPEVRLYVDGRLFMDEKNNPTVVDDWPLHQTKKIHFTELVVGACWEGGENHLSQFFKGHMAGLTVNRGKTESDAVIQCLNNCKEKLDFHSLYLMEGGMSISYNSELTQLTINSQNLTQVTKILSHVGYINYRMFPEPGRRDIKITTDIKCAGERAPLLKIPDVNTEVMVNTGSQPVITISGAMNVMPYERQLRKGGVKLFPGLTIMETLSHDGGSIAKTIAEQFSASTLLKGKIFAENNEAKQTPDADLFELDSCSVMPETDMTSEEVLTYPVNLAPRLGLETKSSNGGLLVTGKASVLKYQSMIREIHYSSSAPEQTRQRVFRLQCSQQHKRYVSNLFSVVVTVIHTHPKVHSDVKVVAHAQQSDLSLQNPGAQHSLRETGAHVKQFIGNTTSFNAVVITVICVGFLMFMIILGVIRIRDAHNKTQVVHVEEKGLDEMEWDNSALTITVNPMDGDDPLNPDNFGEFDHSEMAGIHRGHHDDDYESETEDDDDCSSYRDDDLESSEDEESDKIRRRDLEWDDSTLTF